ncbi:hypothetical protein [Paraburkholderia fungorum]|uniref:hypothetical protein n=1 Tax=Paraburkholderia fungorum TaxID=134537 RepID=UPI002092ADB8|nr:hypothetical protein [Paraburkholderia fungorum]USU18839.1 hypothetical protein NFE55_32305 [Paraburkholderia fungorum]USU29165.1 hypothetical protein NFS19_29265 [Paraburkholderia fungorum]
MKVSPRTAVNRPKTLRTHWESRPRLPKYKDMPQWAQGAFFCLGSVEAAYWGSKVREIAPYVESTANHAFFSLSALFGVTILGLLALEACFFAGMALQCGKYLQEKIFE